MTRLPPGRLLFCIGRARPIDRFQRFEAQTLYVLMRAMLLKAPQKAAFCSRLVQVIWMIRLYCIRCTLCTHTLARQPIDVNIQRLRVCVCVGEGGGGGGIRYRRRSRVCRCVYLKVLPCCPPRVACTRAKCWHRNTNKLERRLRTPSRFAETLASWLFIKLLLPDGISLFVFGSRGHV